MISCFLVWTFAALSPPQAEAEIYKYIDANGQAVYTDNLSALPKNRRRHYRRKQEERKRKLQALEDRIGKDELTRRQVDIERRKLQRQNLNKRQINARLAKLDARLRDHDRGKNARKAKVKTWQDKIDRLRGRLQSKLAGHRTAKATFTQAAFQYNSSSLLGHMQRRNKASASMKRLEQEIDGLLHQINVLVPKQAQAAGVSVKALH
jgi:chromosome segregation ATPase